MGVGDGERGAEEDSGETGEMREQQQNRRLVGEVPNCIVNRPRRCPLETAVYQGPRGKAGSSTRSVCPVRGSLLSPPVELPISSQGSWRG